MPGVLAINLKKDIFYIGRLRLSTKKMKAHFLPVGIIDITINKS
jgi:hypothetical protein